MVTMGPSFKFRKLHKFPQTDDDASCSYGGHESRHHHHDHHHHHGHHHHGHHLTLPFSCRSSRLHCSSNSDHQHHHMSPKKVPKGYVAVYAGVQDDQEGEEEEECNGDEDGDAEGMDHDQSRYNIEGRKRYLVPLSYLTHPAFEELLERAREEFGFRQQAGGLSLPCSHREFEAKLELMESELTDQHPHSPHCVPSLDHLVHTKPHRSIKLH